MWQVSGQNWQNKNARVPLQACTHVPYMKHVLGQGLIFTEHQLYPQHQI